MKKLNLVFAVFAGLFMAENSFAYTSGCTNLMQSKFSLLNLTDELHAILSINEIEKDKNDPTIQFRKGYLDIYGYFSGKQYCKPRLVVQTRVLDEKNNFKGRPEACEILSWSVSECQETVNEVLELVEFHKHSQDN